MSHPILVLGSNMARGWIEPLRNAGQTVVVLDELPPTQVAPPVREIVYQVRGLTEDYPVGHDGRKRAQWKDETQRRGRQR